MLSFEIIFQSIPKTRTMSPEMTLFNVSEISFGRHTYYLGQRSLESGEVWEV